MQRRSPFARATKPVIFVLVASAALGVASLHGAKPDHDGDQETMTDSQAMAAEAKGKPIRMRRLEVTATVVGSIEVNFTMDREDPAYPGATIFWATITDVPPGSTAQKAGFRLGDEIIRLNDQLVRGLTQAEFFYLIRQGRKQGDLTWKVRRGVLGVDYLIVFNGKAGTTE